MKQKQLSEDPEYAAAMERFQTLQNEQGKNRDREIEINNLITQPQGRGTAKNLDIQTVAVLSGVERSRPRALLDAFPFRGDVTMSRQEARSFDSEPLTVNGGQSERCLNPFCMRRRQPGPGRSFVVTVAALTATF